ncbi:uncharacterized protein LOC117121962 [Anneissia japonica]|uniref:uncharacterized protein LOC117121962 n=1 Tax=Anneissia japonica TaxID=1529436 RepID=UPI001425B192|nr:uncharacterized protein LOC117121962 [Anneissia japonica]XP_033123292.1 uncharacterized protein LOC117121962 [Anneissia japonica]
MEVRPGKGKATLVEMECSSGKMTSDHQNSKNLTRIDFKAIGNGNINLQKEFDSAIISKTPNITNHFQTDSDCLKVKLTSRLKQVNASEQEEKVFPQEEESKADCRHINPSSTSNVKFKNPKSAYENIRCERYCSNLFVDLEAISSAGKTYSSSEQEFCELKNGAISTIISSFHTYVLNTKKTGAVKCKTQHRNNCDESRLSQRRQCCIQFEIKPNSCISTVCCVLCSSDDANCGQEIVSETVCSSIIKQLSFVSKWTMDISSTIHPLTSSEMNALVRSKMSTCRPSKPLKCKRFSRKSTSSDIGYLQNLILQSDLVLCNPLEEESDTESDVVSNNEYFSDFCWFDILDLDILYQIFHLLPTRDLAVLKCVCQDFKWLIEFYDIAGVDSKWSESNSYRDDPCMHCGKIKDPSGDVSLCRWHPKGYYKDGHYGRHYWICCRQSLEDAPGCVVGVHDNNWTTSRERLCHIPKPKRKPPLNNYWTLIQ